VALEKDGEQLGPSCEKLRSVTVKEERNILHATERKKA